MELDQPGRGGPARRTASWRRPRGRITDRVVDLVAWLVVALALLVLVLAVAVGQLGHARAMDRVRAEAGERTAVRGVLLEPADVVPSGDASAPMRSERVLARWTAPDSTVVEGKVAVGGRRAAGSSITVWLDRAGAVVAAPVTPASAVAVGWVWGIVTALCGWAVLSMVWFSVRWVAAVRNAAAWARDWERFEPVWSGRVP